MPDFAALTPASPAADDNTPLDVIALGRCSIDLYGEQRYTRLEDVSSFAKYVGGCPANISIGTARLGMSSGFVSRVGNEHMGRFIRDQLVREGVDVAGLQTDPERLTALAILAVRTDDEFPLLFYRRDCADMAIDPGAISSAWLCGAGAVVLTGTHLSTPTMRAVSMQVAKTMRAAGRAVILDIDYRPVLWGMASLEDGASRYVAAAGVTEIVQQFLPLCDLVVGTEEEWHIAGGITDTIESLRLARERTRAVFVVKRGAEGCSTFAAEIGDHLDDAVVDRGPRIEVFNVLGAGDGFMSGYLRGLLGRDGAGLSLQARIERAGLYGNACGALVVSRHGCSVASPSWDELAEFLRRRQHGPELPFALASDVRLERHHAVSTPNLVAVSDSMPDRQQKMAIVALDHRKPLHDVAAAFGVGLDRVAELKAMFTFRLADATYRPPLPPDVRFGLIIDDETGAGGLQALAMLHGMGDSLAAEPAGRATWIGRPIERSGYLPLEFAHRGHAVANPALALADWPRHHVIKCLAFFDERLSEIETAVQYERLCSLSAAARHFRLPLLIEIITSAANGRHDPLADLLVATELYQRGVIADWWKVQPHGDLAVWQQWEELIGRYDPMCEGVVLLGLGKPLVELKADLAAAMRHPIVRGFAVGRTLWMAEIEQSFALQLTLDECWQQVSSNIADLMGVFR